MTTSSLTEVDPTTARKAESSSVCALSRQLLQAATSAKSKQELLERAVPLLRNASSADVTAVVYFPRNEQGELDALPIYQTQSGPQAARSVHQLQELSRTACRSGDAVVELRAARVLIGAPVPRQGADPEAVGCIFSSDEVTPDLPLLIQAVAHQLVLWEVLAGASAGGRIAQESAALVELLSRLAAAPDLRQACQTMVGELQTHLPCRRVAVGLCANARGRCRLAAVSDLAQFDKHSQATLAIEAALDEALMRGALTVWPAREIDERHTAPALQRLSGLEQNGAVVTLPLRDTQGKSVGGILLVSDAVDADSVRFLQAAQGPLAAALQSASRAEGGRLVRAERLARQIWRSAQGKIVLAVVAAALAALAIPLPYRVACECRIEPTRRRFVAAPFEGILERAFVKPGDVVQEGELLARLDGREIRWKRAGLVADQQQSHKKRDAAQAAHNYADMQIAALEMERLELELRLLEHRAEHLEIRSPTAGVIAAGDLERAEGAPLTVGQTLFEIAPLKTMLVEVAVADEDVSCVQPGQTVQLRLDAYPESVWRTTAARLHPRSEIRDENNVFLLEGELDNSDGRLRPGMKGRAKVDIAPRPLGWILFHKPWEFITKTLQW